MSKRKQISIAFMLIFILVLVCGCQDSNTVSKTEYDKVVEERDYYKELYENSVNGESTTELETPEETELIIELTKDNISDFFDFILVPNSVRYSGDDQGETFCAIKSKLYDEGWIYLDSSSDFNIEVRTNPDPGPDGGWAAIWHGDTLFDVTSWIYRVDDFSIESVSGRVHFIHKSAITDYVWDDFNYTRRVTLADGTVKGGLIYNSAQFDYLY